MDFVFWNKQCCKDLCLRMVFSVVIIATVIVKCHFFPEKLW